MTQLDFTGRPALAPPDTPLTAFQRLALDTIGRLQPIASDELGAHLHEDRQRRGKRGHPADRRCQWCADDGKHMGAALRKKGLVKMRQGQGWVLASYLPAERQHDDGYDPGTAEIPF